MNKITIDHAIPNVFQDGRVLTGEVWNQYVELEKGKCYLIEAASGTGKSSMLSFVYGYRRDYSGEIRFDDRKLCTLSTAEWVEIRRHSLSILFQELRLFPELTARENVCIKNNLTKFKTPAEIDAYFEALGIADKKDQPCGKLSFGQQQRVAMIRTLCQPFDFAFLDEPISHLDDTNSAIMGRLITEEAMRQGAGIVVTSIGKHMELDYDTILKL